ncbi:MAG: hypothetical protein ACRD7E_28305, partial [Bryobacteraceae bacterium]
MARRIGPDGSVISTPFQGARIPQARINPTSAAIAALVPLPNFGEPDALSRNYFTQIPTQSDTDQYDFRVDRQLASRNNIFARWSIQDEDSPSGGPFSGFIGNPTNRVNYRRQG